MLLWSDMKSVADQVYAIMVSTLLNHCTNYFFSEIQTFFSFLSPKCPSTLEFFDRGQSEPSIRYWVTCY